MRFVVGVVMCALALLSACGGGGGSSSSPGTGGTGGGDGPFGLDARVAPSGVQVPIALVGGSTQVRAVDAFPNLRPQGQTFMTSARDGTNRLFVTDRNGVIQVFENRPGVTQIGVFMDISGRVDDSTGENGMLGLVFDPAFSSNRRFYVSYVYVPDPSNPNPNARTVRVSRFTADAGGTAGNPASEQVIFEYAHPAGSHFGGWIGFGPEPDGRTLYLSTGDGENAADIVQSPTSPYGKVLRIRLSSDGGSYTVPADNPFGSANPAWARGFRNPWRCSFDRGGNRELWCGDVGQSDAEEVNVVRVGRNYGWPYCEGPFVIGGTAACSSSYEPPLYHYSHAVGAAVIGGYVYRGNAMPQLQGRYFYTDFLTNTIWALRSDGTNEAVVENYKDGLTYAMGEDDSGEVYALAGNGAMWRLEPGAGSVATNPAMPATLSATGLFTDIAQLTPAPGMIDYAPNAPFWSDGAQKYRWVIVPDGQRIGFAANSAWTFPVGTITVKHFELPLSGGGTTRVETRVMVLRSNGWTGYTYRWRGNEQDADLVDAGGASADYQTINPATNTATTLTWSFPSQAQCLQCHTAASGRALGLNTRQFNGNHTYAATGRTDNQLRTLNHIGLFSSDIGAASQYTAMPDPRDTSAALGLRAKAYLDTNCAICHLPGGPTPVTMDLRYATSLADMQLVGVTNQGSVGGVRVVPGNHAGSLLWQRANSTLGSVRMPPLGVQMVDAEGLRLLANWIDGLQ